MDIPKNGSGIQDVRRRGGKGLHVREIFEQGKRKNGEEQGSHWHINAG